jgi:hypothetical protein
MPSSAPKETSLADHLATGRWLHFRCLTCDRDKVISMWEATHRYGHDLTVSEVRRLVHGRCGTEPCRAEIGIALEHQVPKAEK